MAQEIGTNLTAHRPNAAYKFFAEKLKLHGRRAIRGVTTSKFFTKAGIPVENTAADSTGADLCFVWDTTNSDLWLIYEWVAEDDFAVVKILD